jgi:SpoVK/Ycf46/Vps4 family AAA+-type ATPase
VSFDGKAYRSGLALLLPRVGGPLGARMIVCAVSDKVRREAALRVARDLGRGLMAADLGGLISKYIGETEKNLAELFARADAEGALLFFDEADALFGKRSEVIDTGDRFGNSSADYLRRRILEIPRGVFLATRDLESFDSPWLTRMDLLIRANGLRVFKRRLRDLLRLPPRPAPRVRR